MFLTIWDPFGPIWTLLDHFRQKSIWGTKWSKKHLGWLFWTLLDPLDHFGMSKSLSCLAIFVCFIDAFVGTTCKYDIFNNKKQLHKRHPGYNFFISPKEHKVHIWWECRHEHWAEDNCIKILFLQRHPWMWPAIEEANNATARKSIASNINWSFFGYKSIE